MKSYTGRCHCGALLVTFAPRADLLSLRACGCAFCPRPVARHVTDHGGRARIVVRDADALVRYRFGARTADFLLCARCGVYVGAVLEERFATLNVDAFDEVFAGAAEPVDYAGETAE